MATNIFLLFSTFEAVSSFFKLGKVCPREGRNSPAGRATSAPRLPQGRTGDDITVVAVLRFCFTLTQ